MNDYDKARVEESRQEAEQRHGSARAKALDAGCGTQASYQADVNQACDSPAQKLHGLPSRWELQQRRNKLAEELALVEACLRGWTEETDSQIRFAHNLRLLGYHI